MLGLLLIYYIGKQFYQLAHEYDKHEWGFAILGVVSYYAGTFIGGFIISIVYTIWIGSIDSLNEWVLSFLSLPFGILACYGLHKYLTNSWQKNRRVDLEMIDQIGGEE